MTPSTCFLVLLVLVLSGAPAGAQFRLSRSADERLAGVERRRLDVLALILEDAQRAAAPEARARLFEEYLEKSDEFLRDHPDSIGAWSGRAISAVELNRALLAWTAGRNLTRLGAERLDEPQVRRALAMLDRRGWLNESAPQLGPRGTVPWENSLGMKFVPVEGTDVFFCVWETRVRDFAAFVDASGYDATGGMLSFDASDSNWHRRGASWRLPGFDQSADHPVVGVNWYDANAFCAWLTLHERRAGVIGDDQQYRLPYDAEWSAAAGPGTYVWGEQWPPPSDTGNFLGEEAHPVQLRVLEDYHDGAARTARVGRFAANRFGLHDLAGNVQEWCEDLFAAALDGAEEPDTPAAAAAARNFRSLRGASWSYQNATNLQAHRRHRAELDHRIDDVGFRCVIVVHDPTAAPGSDEPAVVVASAPPENVPGLRELPRPIHQVEPDYPLDRVTAGESGTVVVEFDIDERGRVHNAQVRSATHDSFVPPTLLAIRDWRFVPARKQGRAVSCHAIQEFKFNAPPPRSPLAPAPAN